MSPSELENKPNQGRTGDDESRKPPTKNEKCFEMSVILYFYNERKNGRRNEK